MTRFIPIRANCHSNLERDGKFNSLIHFSLDNASHLLKLPFCDLDVKLIMNLK